MSLNKSTIIEAVASTGDHDITGEALDLSGADITPLIEKRGFVNSDHRNDFQHLVGKILDAKKIMDVKDCETPAQIRFWDDLKKPFLWTKAEIWNGSGHKEADSIAAIYKFYQSKNQEPPIKVSVEGKTLKRGPNGKLENTLIRGIALTVQPCNRVTRTAVTEITKSMGTDFLVKAESEVIPSFIEIADDPLSKIFRLSITARELLRNARETAHKAERNEPIALKSRVLLERIKQKTAASKSAA